MATLQPITVAYQPGRTVVVYLWDLIANKVWNFSFNTWVAFNPTDVQQRLFPPDTNGVGIYQHAFPTAITGVVVTQIAYDSADLTNPIGSTIRNELQVSGTANPQPISVPYQPGQTVIAFLWDLTGNKIWNTVSPGLETYDPSNIANYKIAPVDANGVGLYTAIFPTALTGTDITVIAYNSVDLTNPIGSTLIPAMPALDSGDAVLAIINRALSELGVTNIASVDEDSEAAAKAVQQFSTIRDSLLRAHFWKFASYIDTLALISGETVMGWQFLYAYPPRCLMIRKIFDQSCVNPGGDLLFDARYFGDLWLFYHPEFRFKEVLSTVSFQKSIAANINPAYIEYTYQVTDPNQWDQAFTDAMVYSLAAELARPLTGKTDLVKVLRDAAASIVSEAKRLDSQEDNSRRQQQSTYQRSRM